MNNPHQNSWDFDSFFGSAEADKLGKSHGYCNKIKFIQIIYYIPYSTKKKSNYCEQKWGDQVDKLKSS